jgi:hypothetical protein
MVSLLLHGCPECAPSMAARAWALEGHLWPLLALLMLPLGLTLGAAAVVYGLSSDHR